MAAGVGMSCRFCPTSDFRRASEGERGYAWRAGVDAMIVVRAGCGKSSGSDKKGCYNN